MTNASPRTRSLDPQLLGNQLDRAAAAGATIFGDQPAVGPREVLDLGPVTFLAPFYRDDALRLVWAGALGGGSIEYLLHMLSPLLTLRNVLPAAMPVGSPELKPEPLAQPMADPGLLLGPNDEGHLFFAELDARGEQPVVRVQIRTETRMLTLQASPENILALSEATFRIYEGLTPAQREGRVIKLEMDTDGPEQLVYDTSHVPQKEEVPFG